MADDNVDDLKEEVAELASFDPTKKKKKKKVVIQEADDDSVDKLSEKTDSLSASEGLESSFAGLKKKKKKPVEASILNEESNDGAAELDDQDREEETGLQRQCYPWDGSERDYTYEEHLYPGP